MPFQFNRPANCFLIIGTLLTAGAFSSYASAKEALAPLTFTTRQIVGGKANYGDKCAKCHGADLEGGAAPALVDGAMDKYLPGPVNVLADYLKANMPRDSPGSLTTDEISTLIAYIASKNDRKAGETPLPTDKAVLAKMGFDQ